MDWKSIVKAVAPTIGAALGGPLGGTALRTIAGILLGDENASEEAIQQAVISASPEMLLSLKKADQEFEKAMRELGIKEQALYVDDTKHARDSHKGDRAVFRLGLAVLSTFALVMGFSMYGAYELLTGGMHVQDMGVVAAVFGFLGTVIGYVAANAQQVVAYFFGSSAGSKQKTDAMSEAVSNMASRKID